MYLAVELLCALDVNVASLRSTCSTGQPGRAGCTSHARQWLNQRQGSFLPQTRLCTVSLHFTSPTTTTTTTASSSTAPSSSHPSISPLRVHRRCHLRFLALVRVRVRVQRTRFLLNSICHPRSQRGLASRPNRSDRHVPVARDN